MGLNINHLLSATLILGGIFVSNISIYYHHRNIFIQRIEKLNNLCRNAIDLKNIRVFSINSAKIKYNNVPLPKIYEEFMDNNQYARMVKIFELHKKIYKIINIVVVILIVINGFIGVSFFL